MTNSERHWIIGGTIVTIAIMVGFLFLMSDYSPLYHPAGSRTQELIETLGSWQDNEASGELILE